MTQGPPESVTEPGYIFFASQLELMQLLLMVSKSPAQIGDGNLERATMLELVAVRLSENFEIYLSDLLIILHLKQPDLMSKERLSGKQILECKTYDNVLRALAEACVYDIIREGLETTQMAIKSKFKLKVFDEHSDIERVNRYNQERNLLVHNRGIVNKRFLSKVPDASSYKEGERLTVDAKTLKDRFLFFERVVTALDVRVAEQFNLPRQPFKKGK